MERAVRVGRGVGRLSGMTDLKGFFLVTYVNRDQMHLNEAASSAIIILSASEVGSCAAPVIKVTHLCPAVGPPSLLLVTLSDLKSLD